jgi:hypothetical protein
LPDRQSAEHDLGLMNAVVAGLIGALIGASATLVASLLTRKTERQRALRESMITQAADATRALRASVYAIEQLADGKPKLGLRSADGKGKTVQVEAREQALAEQANAARACCVPTSAVSPRGLFARRAGTAGHRQRCRTPGRATRDCRHRAPLREQGESRPCRVRGVCGRRYPLAGWAFPPPDSVG